MTLDNQAGQIYELAGDESYSLMEFAAAIGQHSGKDIAYLNLPEADYRAALVSAGLPEGLAKILAESDVGASKVGLFDASHQLSQLIGRSTTHWASMVAAAVA